MEFLTHHDLRLRRAKPDDLLAVSQLYHDVWHETQANLMSAHERARRGMDFFITRMTDYLSQSFIVEYQNKLLAFSAWQNKLLGQLFVLKEWRGSGLASPLLSATEQAMFAQGVAQAELHCIVGNTHAKRFYERQGWCLQNIDYEIVSSSAETYKIHYWLMTKTIQPKD